MKIAAIGGGVIGGGWIARFILAGHDVRVFDPHPEAQRIVGEVMANASRAWAKMFLAPLPEPGQIIWTKSIAEAVEGADYIQESVPERLDLKHKILAEIEAAAPATAIIGSSTSGFKPSELREGAKHPARILVAHPFNPVYLLPVVEIVGGGEAAARATALLTEVGMKPVSIAQEIDAHIGDRLLEAVWREALWLVNDGIATTEEIDDIIRYGFGLRWAQMGLFETYRIAGGEAGMKHFLAQFGPALKWPWTKLMDVPDLDDRLVGMIADQSDAQSGKHSIRELERIRDDNLVGIFQALKANDWGAGQSLREMENRFYARKVEAPSGYPLRLHTARVSGDWLDYNGHMTEFRYLQVLGDATDAFMIHVGLDEAYRAGGFSAYTVETHIRHLAESSGGEKLTVETRLIGHDAKKFRLFHRILKEDGTEAATGEHMLLHVDTKAGRTVPMNDALKARLDQIATEDAALPAPEAAGAAIRAIGQREAVA
ncbi:carnitine 3-dehydrogenase [Paracoccus aminophilus]|uniref:L-carnitine dehydrogenase n=1 Tax=Paracoccus aminophilus JCM 7686 TaxID=1367847 RepID=S5YIW3_PARAH|nr:carnitine 3-dehydrogenase [Paracoccus aminophilus]AGT11413.1 bifunctional 3-hydroxyacyl-CoA dehydrogenase/thioesterase [Paracoccus aminophilus JCM 7686]